MSNPPINNQPKSKIQNENFEKERSFFEDNENVITNQVASLQKELEEEITLSKKLDSTELSEEKINKVKEFLSKKEKIETLYSQIEGLDSRLKELILENKVKAQKISELNSEYSILVNSQEALDLTLTVRNIRDSLKNFDDFLVKEGVKGPASIN